ncbi:MAG: M48 family metalloprotease [Candidatus Synoicihabitans palmerolidicus]|nr:M48 family metalloprotease [Candidatus Synoicihabitans palmerolidicus]
MNGSNSIVGTYFSGRLTAAIPARACLEQDAWAITSLDGTALVSHPRDNVKVSERLTDVPRLLTFPDGSSGETHDNSSIDDLGLRNSGQRFASFVHFLETQAPVVAIATVLLVASIAATFKFGLPRVAESIATNLPDSVEANIGAAAMTSVNSFSAVTTLSPTERSEVYHQLERISPSDATGPDLHLRNVGGLPNAFALPGHQIVVTDALVRLLTSGQLAAVLAH